jgi:transmembrane sensor
VAAARADIDSDRISKFPTPFATGHLTAVEQIKDHRVRRILIGIGVAASLAVIAVLLAFNLKPDVTTRSFLTRVGEQLTVSLADGSIVRLNAQSKLRVRFGPGRRDVQLLFGEAFFQVAKDPTRPFVVSTESAQVEAVGTAFNVDLRDDRTTVTVVEGRVGLAVSSDDRAAVPAQSGAGASPELGGKSPADRRRQGRTFLEAQEQATVTNDGRLLDVKTVEAADVLAWTEQRLVFKGETLEQVVVEFNRYNLAQLEIRDPALAEIRISGVFAANDPDSLVTYLERSEKVTVSVQGSTLRVLSRSR